MLASTLCGRAAASPDERPPKPPAPAPAANSPDETQPKPLAPAPAAGSSDDTPPKPPEPAPAVASPEDLTPKPQAVAASSKGADKPRSPAKRIPLDWEVNAQALGIYDTNLFEKGDLATTARGTDIALGGLAGYGIARRISAIGAASLGTSVREGFSRGAGANALKFDGGARLGLEMLLLGQTSLPGRKIKTESHPSLRLAVEGRYAYSATPNLEQPARAPTDPIRLVDNTADAFQSEDPADDESSSGASEEDEKGDEKGEAKGTGKSSGSVRESDATDSGVSPAGSGGPQAFRNPFTHHKVASASRASLELSKTLGFGLDGAVARDMVDLTNVKVSPQYTELLSGLNGRYKIFPNSLWLTAGYSFDRRWFDVQPNANGDRLRFSMHGLKVAVDVPTKRAKFRLSYDFRQKVTDNDPSGDQSRHQGQLVVEVPLFKYVSVLADSRVSSTSFVGKADALRFIAMAGLKFKM